MPRTTEQLLVAAQALALLNTANLHPTDLYSYASALDAIGTAEDGGYMDDNPDATPYTVIRDGVQCFNDIGECLYAELVADACVWLPLLGQGDEPADLWD